jgi:hypothetical protein
MRPGRPTSYLADAQLLPRQEPEPKTYMACTNAFIVLAVKALVILFAAYVVTPISITMSLAVNTRNKRSVCKMSEV